MEQNYNTCCGVVYNDDNSLPLRRSVIIMAKLQNLFRNIKVTFFENCKRLHYRTVISSAQYAAPISSRRRATP